MKNQKKSEDSSSHESKKNHCSFFHKVSEKLHDIPNQLHNLKDKVIDHLPHNCRK